ncbi:MAG: hypothetical protein QOF77_766 [Solirubrobacteraceae bacterium]|nr:hypothetical protein [Solirubrobacteraceae bacterium]
MTLEDHTVDDNLARRCEVCGATLTTPEIEVSREVDEPFLCSVHATEQLPVDALAEDEVG